MAFERIAEQRIRQAMNEGEFDALPNARRLIDRRTELAMRLERARRSR